MYCASVIDCVNTIIESVDVTNMTDQIMRKLGSVMHYIFTFYSNPAAIAPEANKEQLEIFMNHYSSCA